jgi:glycosyltransferase involved in cell wall biosynthesis
VAVGASGAVVDALRPLLPESGAPPLHLIENGARLVDRTSRDRTGRNVLYIGRPTDSKGYPAFLRLVRELGDHGLGFFANTVSIPPQSTVPEVTFSRCLADEGLLALFAAVDLVVAPYWRADGLPLALLEALNCGVPMVGFDSPAVGPLLRHFDQHVVPCDTGALISAVSAWSRGELHIEPPPGGCVPTLLGQAERHVDVVTRVTEEAMERKVIRRVS